MGYFRLFTAIMAFLLVSALSGTYAGGSVQEQSPAVSPDENRTVEQAGSTAPAGAGQEGSGRFGKKEKAFTAVLGPDGIQYVEITAGEYYFDPRHIVVKVNVPVELRVRKEPGFIPHNIVLRAPEAGMDFNVGLKKEPLAIRFTPKKTGSYEMFCDKKLLFFKSHREKGMKGIIEVVE